MPDGPAVSPVMPKRVGVAADHGGFALKEQLVGMLRGAGHEVLDFGDDEPKPGDTMQIMLCLWPMQSRAGRWIAVWPSVEVA